MTVYELKQMLEDFPEELEVVVEGKVLINVERVPRFDAPECVNITTIGHLL